MGNNTNISSDKKNDNAVKTMTREPLNSEVHPNKIDQDSQREIEFNELFKAKEEINSEIHKSKNIDISFSKYSLINTNWYNDYLHFLKKPNQESNDRIKEKLFKYRCLHPKSDKRDYSYIDKAEYTFPSDFVFVTKNFVNLISEYISTYDYNNLDHFKKYLFETAIGGECIIMKSFVAKYSENLYIVIYEENKGNINNNIDFILMIDDDNEMEKVLDFILKNNIWNYLKMINLSIEEDEKEIKNDKGKKIGYIVRNGEIKRKEKVKEIQKMHSDNNITTPKIITKLDSVLWCLFFLNVFYQELSKFSSDNKNVITKIFVEYFQNFNIDKIKSKFSKSIKTDIFEFIFEEIFGRLDLELSNENEIKELDGKEEQLEAFKDQYKNGSFIKRLFYCPQEINKYCLLCQKTFHKYKNNKIILMKFINTKIENILFDKIFKEKKILKKEICKICNRESECLNYKKYISYPKILIIVIEENQIGKLNIEKNIKNDDEGISYELYCFIEANTNMVYFKDDYGKWKRFTDNKEEDIERKIPIVFFYKLMDIKNNIIINNNEKNNNKDLMINNINKMNKDKLKDMNENDLDKNITNIIIRTKLNNMNDKNAHNNFTNNNNESLNYKNNINKLNQINCIENELEKSKKQIVELEKENEKLRHELEEEKKINKNLEEKIKNLQNISNQLSGYNNELKKKEVLLNEKNTEMSKLKLRYPFELLDGEKMISITFISFDELIQYSIICKNTHVFREIKNMFYDKYIEYKDRNGVFLIKGKKIDSNKTLEENNINNGDVISFKANG